MPADVWLQPLATVLGAVIVGAAAYFTLRQKRAADDAALRLEREALAHQREVDRRQQWWLRAQWAIDRSLSPDPLVAELGSSAVAILSDEAADRADLALLLLAVRDAVDTPARHAQTGPASAEGVVRGAGQQP